MKKCVYCNNNMKLVKKEHPVRSRNQNSSEVVFEDLKTLVCTVCGHSELPESSEHYVNFIKQKLRKEMAHPSNRTEDKDKKQEVKKE